MKNFSLVMLIQFLLLITFSVGIYGDARAVQWVNWKVVLMTGDNSIRAFDNARRDIKSIFLDYGINKKNIKELSSSQSEQVFGVKPASFNNLEKSLRDLKVKPGDGCVVYLTSHGSKRGFFIRKDRVLKPERLNDMLNKTCGDHPTVLIVSACYSGIFAEPIMRKANRVILTAASKNRPSFGCGADNYYTYWDGCFIENLPKSFTWEELSINIKACVQRKEKKLNELPSNPQARFGDKVRHLPLLNNVSILPRESEPLDENEDDRMTHSEPVNNNPEKSQKAPSHSQKIHDSGPSKSERTMENHYWDDSSLY